MHSYRKLAAAGAIAAAVSAVSAVTAAAAPPRHDTDRHFAYGAVFVQSDNTTANTVVAYGRAPGGTLTEEGVYSSGGVGGQLGGSVVDHLASQDSLVYDREQGLLFAVNAGSNTVSVFDVRGTQLLLAQVINSGGTFPVSVAVHGDQLYVLNALGGGSLQGYYIAFGRLFPIAGSSRALGLSPTEVPQFTSTPGEVGFTPDGRQLVVTTKNNGDDIDVFGVDWLGRLSAAPVVNSEPNTVPFGFVFDPAGRLEVAEAGPSDVATFALESNGTVQLVTSLATVQPATCWVTEDGSVLYASNAGGPSISSVSFVPWGSLTLLATTATDKGTVDATPSPDGRYLYVQAGGLGTVDEFSVGTGGSLTSIGSLPVPGGAGGEGIAAS
jgi:6-phosphogluconolactonase (cycloisomerase 2 family)